MADRIFLGVADALLANCLGNLLGDHYQVLLPQRCDQLVHEAEKLQPHLLLLDDSLEEDPATLCLTLSRRLPSCPLLYLSTNWQPSLAAQLQAHGVDRVLRKPFSTDKLLSTIKELLDTTTC